MFTPPPEWYAPKRCTCSVWAIRQRFRCGGRVAFERHQKIPYLFRGFWLPPIPLDRANPWQWYSYLPVRPKDHKVERWWVVLWDSLWFEGHVQPARRK